MAMPPLTVPVVFIASFAVSLGGAFFTFRLTRNYQSAAIVFGGVFLFGMAYGWARMLE